MIELKKFSESEWHFEHNGYRGLIYKLNQKQVAYYWSIFKDSKRVSTGRTKTLADSETQIKEYLRENERLN